MLSVLTVGKLTFCMLDIRLTSCEKNCEIEPARPWPTVKRTVSEPPTPAAVRQLIPVSVIQKVASADVRPADSAMLYTMDPNPSPTNVSMPDPTVAAFDPKNRLSVKYM